MLKELLRYIPSSKKPLSKRGFSYFGTIFITGFIGGVILVSMSLYYYYALSAPLVPEQISENDRALSNDRYIEPYQVRVTAFVPEFLGLKSQVAGNGQRYLIVFGNTVSGFVVGDSGLKTISQADGMPGDGYLIRIDDNGKYYINVKY